MDYRTYDLLRQRLAEILGPVVLDATAPTGIRPVHEPKLTPELYGEAAMIITRMQAAGYNPDLMECYRYELPEGEGHVIYNISLAKTLIKRAALARDVPIVGEDIPRILKNLTEEDEQYIPLVDISEKGIAARLRYDDEWWVVMIDGQHRLAKAHRDGIGFFVDLLTDEDTRKIVMEATKKEWIP